MKEAKNRCIRRYSRGARPTCMVDMFSRFQYPSSGLWRPATNAGERKLA